MKKQLLMLGAAFMFSFGTTTLVSCGGGESQEAHDHAEGEESHEGHDHAQFQCPMDCEEGKTYEEMGTCPVCKMDLAEVKPTE